MKTIAAQTGLVTTIPLANGSGFAVHFHHDAGGAVGKVLYTQETSEGFLDLPELPSDVPDSVRQEVEEMRLLADDGTLIGWFLECWNGRNLATL